jgi:quinohemoprotein amine dehydrogenase
MAILMRTFTKLTTCSCILLGLLLSVGRYPLLATAAQQTRTSTPEPPEEGIPIPDEAVQKACAPCHKTDGKGQISRLSFRRNTPEGWETSIRRMVDLNGLKIDPATARQVVQYLSNHLGLAPEEAKPAAFESERQLIDYKFTASKDTEEVCIKCHSIGRVMLQRRTKEEWNLLISMHRGWYPLSDFQAFRRMGPLQREPGPDGRPPDNRHPVEKALEYLTTAYPLFTPEWAAWSATMRPPKLEGTWTISGRETGKGAVYGRMTIAPGASPEEFITEIALTYARTGQTVMRKGRSIVYTGYQWRGRSTEGGKDETSLREVMFVDRDWQSMDGRWFTGGYDEIGMDVQLKRIAGAPVLLGASRTALRAGTSGQEVRLYGANLPGSLATRDIDFGQGINVTRIVSATPDVVTIAVDVAPNAANGPRDAALGGAVKPAALAVYDRVDYIKVAPDWSMARLGGANYPKGLARFEALGFHNGQDSKPNTKDDIELGMVDAKWSLEEYSAVLNDEDLKYVGTIDASTGVFTPSLEGPNPNRPGNANNVGDVWVLAAYTPDGSGKTVRLRARAHLLVTVPLYMRWGATGVDSTQ